MLGFKGMSRVRNSVWGSNWGESWLVGGLVEMTMLATEVLSPGHAQEPHVSLVCSHKQRVVAACLFKSWLCDA